MGRGFVLETPTSQLEKRCAEPWSQRCGRRMVSLHYFRTRTREARHDGASQAWFYSGYDRDQGNRLQAQFHRALGLDAISTVVQGQNYELVPVDS